MQQYFIKQQSNLDFLSQRLKYDIFSIEQNHSGSLIWVQQNQSSKFKLSKVNTQEAKTIFVELNKKSSGKQVTCKKNWKHEQTCLLIYLVDKFSFLEKVSNLSEFSSQIWGQIQQFLPGRSAQDCKYKALSLTASTITNIPWSIEERNILTAIIEQEGMNWNVVSQRLYEQSNKKVFRTSKQCREHYMCFLKPNLKKGAWTEQQDYKLVCLFLEYGRKWSKIMKLIEGRNQNSIKNRFFLLFENKGKTSNFSDLLRKVKRKKQRMEKTLKDSLFDFSLRNQQKSLEQINLDKNWEKLSQIQIYKSTVEPETRRGEEMDLGGYLPKQQQNDPQSRRDLHESLQCGSRISLNNFQSYQHLDFSQLEIESKQIRSIPAFDSFEKFICF